MVKILNNKWNWSCGCSKEYHVLKVKYSDEYIRHRCQKHVRGCVNNYDKRQWFVIVNHTYTCLSSRNNTSLTMLNTAEAKRRNLQISRRRTLRKIQNFISIIRGYSNTVVLYRFVTISLYFILWCKRDIHYFKLTIISPSNKSEIFFFNF